MYDFITDVKDEKEVSLPKNFGLTQNYPNPFNGQTNIEFQISSLSNVKIQIFNILGQKIKTLLDEEKSPGYYTIIWDSKNDFGDSMNSGIYFIKFNSGKFTETKKMTLLK